MYRPTIAALAALMLLAPMAGAFSLSTEELAPLLPEDDQTRPGTDQWIVGFYEMPELREGDLYMGERIVSVTPELSFITVHSLAPDALHAKVALDENVRYIETDVSDHTLYYTPNDYYWNHASNWGPKKIGAVTAWDRTRGSTSVKDGHIDSGIFRSHEDLQGTRFLTGWNWYSNNNNPADNSGCGWHGTHTIGTAAATINNAKGFAGMAQMTVLPVKIFSGSACYGASTTNIANAIRYVGDQGSHLSSNSWGGGAYSTAIFDAITYSTNKGVIFVAAAGNGGCSNCVSEPWKSQEARTIIVTATDSNNAGASFNSKGPQTDIAAPGVYIGSSVGPYSNSYAIMDGTSMATPHVAGVVGLIKTLNPSMSYTSMQTRLKSTATDLGVAGEDDTFGAGLVNAAAAVY